MKLLRAGADGELSTDVIRLLSPVVEVTACVTNQLDVMDRAGLQKAVETLQLDVVVNSAVWAVGRGFQERKPYVREYR